MSLSAQNDVMAAGLVCVPPLNIRTGPRAPEGAEHPARVDRGRVEAVAGLKTAGACNDEYKANKGALKDAKEKKKDFIAACRALPPGTPTPIGTAAVAPAPAAPPPASVPAPQAPSASTSRREAPAPGPSAASAPSARTSASPGESACGNAYAHLPANHTAVQFCDEGQAKARLRRAAGRLGQHEIEDLPSCRRQHLRAHEGGRLHVRRRREGGRRSGVGERTLIPSRSSFTEHDELDRSLAA